MRPSRVGRASVGRLGSTIGPALQPQKATDIEAKVVEVDASHVAMLSRPEDVVAVVGDAVRALANPGKA